MSDVTHTGAEIRAAFLKLSSEARGLMQQILTGSHSGAHPVTGTDAEAEAVTAGCIVTDGKHIWVAQEAAELTDAWITSELEADARAREWAQNSQDNDARRYLSVACNSSQSYMDACIAAGLGPAGRGVTEQDRFDAIVRLAKGVRTEGL